MCSIVAALIFAADGTRTPNAVKAGVRRVRDLLDKLYRVCLAGEIIE